MPLYRVPFFLIPDENETQPTPSSKNILVVGERNVGKSSIIRRLVSNTFSLYHTPTNTIEIYSAGRHRLYEIPHNIDFNLKRYIEASIILIVYTNKNRVTAGWWEAFLTIIRPSSLMEVYFVHHEMTRGTSDTSHRTFCVNALENRGFAHLVREIA